MPRLIIVNDDPGKIHAFQPEDVEIFSKNKEISDGHHTFDELYHHRAVLFSVIVSKFKKLCWKSLLHDDGTMFDGDFIVGIETPWGQATYHYKVDKYWDMFQCKVLEKAPPFDGHTSAEAIDRIRRLLI